MACALQSSAFPPTVHSLGRYGFASGLIALARAVGRSGYVGDGSNRWPSVDTRDAARLYRLALESAPAGSRLHAVAEESVTLGETAEGITRQVGVPTASITREAAAEHFGYLASFIGLDTPASIRITRDLLGWTPAHPGLLADLLQASS